MRRDMDLVRDALRELSESSGPLDARALACDAHPFEEVAYHFGIIVEAGLARGRVTRAWGGVPVAATLDALTWEGNDLLDSVRDERVWARVKRAVGKAVGAASLETVKAAAVKVATAAVLGQL